MIENIYKLFLFRYAMIKIGGKKGEETSFVMRLIIGLAFLLVVLIAIFYAKSWGSDVGKNIPAKVDLMITGCQSAVSLSSVQGINAYCHTVREIAKNKYVTCDYAGKEGITIYTESGSASKTKIDAIEKICATPTEKENRGKRIVAQCVEKELKDTAIVNGKTCKQWTGGECVGSTDPCSSFNEILECGSQKECAWVEGDCANKKGVANVDDCSGFKQSVCTSDANKDKCSWTKNPHCKGDATACPGLDYATCGSTRDTGQQGCAWEFQK